MPLSVTAFQIMYFKWFVTALEGIEASWGHSDKKPTCQYRRNRFVPWLRKSPGVGNGNPQYPCLENSMDKEAWQATQSMGLQRVRHDWVSAHTHMQTHTHRGNVIVNQFNFLPPILSLLFSKIRMYGDRLYFY